MSCDDSLLPPTNHIRGLGQLTCTNEVPLPEGNSWTNHLAKKVVKDHMGNGSVGGGGGGGGAHRKESQR